MFAMRRRSAVAATLAGVAVFGWRGNEIGVLATSSTCVFRFEGYLNISEPPIWTVPAAEPLTTNDTVLNEGAPIIYYVSDTDIQEVNCTSTGWQYLNGETWMTEVAFPDEEPTDYTAFQRLFSVTNGSDLEVAPVPAAVRVAVSDSLYGRTIQVDLTCDDVVVEDEDSCVIFEVDFINSSPVPDITTALFRFEDPAVPAFELPDAQPNSPGDIQLNVDNDIVNRDGSEVYTACNGDVAEYLGEDGEWYFWYTGSDGNMYNLTHVFYAANQTQLNIATIQKVWSTNMEAALYNRTVRLLTHCTNVANFEEGYIFFNIGDFNVADLLETCETLPELCVAVTSTSAAATNMRYNGGWKGWILALCSAFVAIGLASAHALQSGML